MSDLDKKLKEVFCDTFTLEESQINEDLTADDVETWDSINHLSLVMNLEDATGVKFSTEEITQLVSYKAIKSLVEAKS